MTTIEINGHTMLEDICVSVTAESGRRDDDSVRLSVHVTGEGIILDAFDKDGNCTGTLAADYDGWEARLNDDAPLPHEFDDRALLSEAFDYLTDHQDAGPVPNGWKSPDLEALIETIAARLRSG